MYCRAVARSENLGGLAVLVGENGSPLVEIGLTVWPKDGGLRTPPAPPPLATALREAGRRLQDWGTEVACI